MIDVGAGTGRYAIPLLERSHQIERVIAVEPSVVGRQILLRRAKTTCLEARLHIHASLQSVDEKAHLCLAIFGVLGHITDRTARLRLLNAIHDRLSPDGRLVVSVPSIYRRFPRHVVRSYLAAPTRFRGKIEYERSLGSNRRSKLEYQLYSACGLRRELEIARFTVTELRAESLLPESTLARHRGLAQLDGLLTSILPASLGYGILALAKHQ